MQKGGTFSRKGASVLIIVLASFMVLVLRSGGSGAGRVLWGCSAEESSAGSNRLVAPSLDYCNMSVKSTFTVVDNLNGARKSVHDQPPVQHPRHQIQAARKAFMADPRNGKKRPKLRWTI